MKKSLKCNLTRGSSTLVGASLFKEALKMEDKNIKEIHSAIFETMNRNVTNLFVQSVTGHFYTINKTFSY